MVHAILDNCPIKNLFRELETFVINYDIQINYLTNHLLNVFDTNQTYMIEKIKYKKGKDKKPRKKKGHKKLEE